MCTPSAPPPPFNTFYVGQRGKLLPQTAFQSFHPFLRGCAKNAEILCFTMLFNTAEAPPSDRPLKFYNQETKRMKRKIKQRKNNLEDLSQVNISVIVSVDNTEARDRLKKRNHCIRL